MKTSLSLGSRAVIADSFERIHRSDLVGMGVMPLEFPAGVTRETLGLTGEELIELCGFTAGLVPGLSVRATIRASMSSPT